MKTGHRLDRRRFLKTTGAGLAGIALLPRSPGDAVAGNSAVSPRRILDFNHKWLFSDKPATGATKLEFNDAGFERVTIPHTNKMLPWHGFDDKDYQFVSVYRRHFKLPDELRGRRIFVDFGGVMTAATVFLNGQRLGEYRGGYTPFSFELTQHLKWRGDNVLAVEVDSTERKDIPPFGGLIDYLTFGGIYRDVTLRAVGDTFIENVFARPASVLTPDRRVDVRCFVTDASKTRRPLKLTVELLDGKRVVAANSSRELDPAAGPRYEVSLRNLGLIELWDLRRPKLYQVRARLFKANCASIITTRASGFAKRGSQPTGFF